MVKAKARGGRDIFAKICFRVSRFQRNFAIVRTTIRNLAEKTMEKVRQFCGYKKLIFLDCRRCEISQVGD
jgi:hypothetical protein